MSAQKNKQEKSCPIHKTPQPYIWHLLKEFMVYLRALKIFFYTELNLKGVWHYAQEL